MADSNEKKTKVTLPLVISTIALIISLLSFYFTHLRVNHSMMLAPANLTLSSDKLPCNLTSDFVLLNYGNRTETLIRAELVYQGFGEWREPKSRKGPFVLKSGDAIPVQVQQELTDGKFFDSANKKGDKDFPVYEILVTLELSTLNPQGQEVVTSIPLGRIIYDERAAHLKHESSPGTNTRLLEVIR